MIKRSLDNAPNLPVKHMGTRVRMCECVHVYVCVCE